MEMAASLGACNICFSEFDDKTHQALILPCSHIYCSKCLSNLQTDDQKKCPTCQKDWKMNNVDSLEKWISQEQKKEQEEVPKKTEILEMFKCISCSDVSNVLCKEHSLPFYYFCDHCKEFSCVRCVIAKQPHCNFIMISDALDLIKSNITDKCNSAKYETESDLDQLKKILSEITQKIIFIKEFYKDLEDVQQQISGLTESLEAIQDNRNQDLLKVATLQTAIAEINTDNVVTEVHSCLEVLQTVHSGKVKSLDFSELNSLICQVVCSFRETSQQRDLINSQFECFINKLRNIESYKVEDIESASKHSHFASGGLWIVYNNSSYQAALDALTKHRPAAVLVVATGQHSEDLLMKLLTALAGVECEVKLRFLDSFYIGFDSNKDHMRLSNLFGSDWSTHRTENNSISSGRNPRKKAFPNNTFHATSSLFSKSSRSTGIFQQASPNNIFGANIISATASSVRPRLTEFVGYLNPADQTRVLERVTSVGLHCKNLKDIRHILKVIDNNQAQHMQTLSENQKNNFLTRAHFAFLPGVNVNGAETSFSFVSDKHNSCVTFALHVPRMEDEGVECVPRFPLTTPCGLDFGSSSYTIAAASLHLPECRLTPAGAEKLAEQLAKGNKNPSHIYLNSDAEHSKHQDEVIAVLRKNGHFVSAYDQKFSTAWDMPM